MQPYQPIDCAIHDHLEVACLFRYAVGVTLHTGATISGRARSWETRQDKAEYLLLDVADAISEIRLDQIAHIEVRSQNARFSHIDFGGECAPPPHSDSTQHE